MPRLFSADDPVIAKIDEQIAQLANIGLHRVPGTVAPLTREHLSQLVEGAFWASLRSNEGRPTRVSVAVATARTLPGAVAFQSPVEYTESQVVRLAPAVPQGGCLVVSAGNDELQIEGFSRVSPAGWLDPLWLGISEPGIVLANVGPFQPYALLDGRSNSIIGATRTNLAHYLQRALSKVLTGKNNLETQAVWRECIALAELARAVMRIGRGGILLIVPDDSNGWPESLDAFPYRFAAPDTGIRDAIRRELEQARSFGDAASQLSQAPIPEQIKNLAIAALSSSASGGMRPTVYGVASLAKVDGAIVVSRDLRVIGFGARIRVDAGADPKLYVMQPELRADEPSASPLETLGATRHQSAVRFVAANRKSVAIVVSQDRRLTVLRWDEAAQAVIAMCNAGWW